MDILITAVLFIIVLSVLVLVHEAGHFLAARRAGIRVEEFGLGLPPKIFGRKIGETEYTLNLLPIGGFVRLYGETPDGVSVRGEQENGQEVNRMFLSKSKLARTSVLLAGVTANLLLGMVLFSIVYSVGLPVYGTKPPQITNVQEGSPAAQAGIKEGDTIVALNGTHVEALEQPFSEAINRHQGQEITLTIEQDGHEKQVALTPRQNPPAGQGAIGVAMQLESYQKGLERYPIWEAWWVGTKEAIALAGAILASLGQMLSNAVVERSVPEGIAGPVGIAAIMGQARDAGWVVVLWFAGMISINLAVINILPLPALDGGRLLFIAIEAIARRKVSQNFEQWTHTIGMAVLLGLILLITFADITRLLS